MLTIGLCGGLSLAHETLYDLPQAFPFDAAAALVRDGAVVAAAEEERFNRIRHSGKFPSESLRFCLRSQGVAAGDIDRFAYYSAEPLADGLLARLFMTRPDVRIRSSARAMLCQAIGRELQAEIAPEKVAFIPHKLTHALSAFAASGFGETLVLVLDNDGGAYHGRPSVAGPGGPLEQVASFPPNRSIGRLFDEILPFLGYGPFDVCRIAELAPLGDAATGAALIAPLYSLRPDGDYEIHWERIPSLFGQLPIRKSQQPLAQAHRDVAAALERAMEEIVLHVARALQARTGLRTLCVAGGMGQNTAVNRALLDAGVFDRIYVQPATHDAGCALGAALAAYYDLAPSPRFVSMPDPFLGSDLGSDAEIERELSRWDRFLSVERTADPAALAAEELAGGAIVGWVQGRAEFGLRSLGNRSLLADPRSEALRERLAAEVKGPEGDRPFEVSVLEADAAELFTLQPGVEQLRWKSFDAPVRSDRRDRLAAATQADGTARVQTVSAESNPLFAALLAAWKVRSGVPALLSTSLANGVEPMADSVRDAVVTFLTTGVDVLFAGNYRAGKRPGAARHPGTLVPSLPAWVQLHRMDCDVGGARGVRHELRTTADALFRRMISDAAGDLLLRADGIRTVDELLAEGGAGSAALVEEIGALWSERLVTLAPPVAAA